PVVPPGSAFSVSTTRLDLREGQQATLTAEAGGARKVSWILVRDGVERVVAVDRFSFTFDAGRIAGDTAATLRFQAACADGVKTRDIPITIREAIPEPVFTLTAPPTWDGRESIEVVPRIDNSAALAAKGVGEIETEWTSGPLAVVKQSVDGRLRLLRAQNSGRLTVTATLRNGGQAVTRSIEIMVTEPRKDAWVHRVPEKDEKPQEGQFYARDDQNQGTLFYTGTLAEPADSVFLRLYADDRLLATETAKPGADGSYGLTMKLAPGLVVYRVEFGVKTGSEEKVLDRVGDLVCGDAFLIDGQSNALATDTPATAPPETSPWIRSYGRPTPNPQESQANLWCLPVWRARAGEKAELGWWGMELAKRLVESRKMPVFIINGAVGGTRIDQHQRNEADPTDLGTIYGRMLWRARQARITHGIRGIIWHQGENDQGADGPTGGFGWETYQQLFVEMSGGWKRDFPNVQHYYVFQIWPNACAMGGRDGSGDRLREAQRTLPKLFSNMSILSTLGVRPPGGCHYPLEGWAEFAGLLEPLIERDHHGVAPRQAITSPNLLAAVRLADDLIALDFDQPVRWDDSLAGQFYLDGEKGLVAGGSVTGNRLTLRLSSPGKAAEITYLKEASWSQDTLLLGTNGLAALTFCEVPIQEDR
ncbi:MAG: sialate O-acetylesterase, partial [Planctomycetia bacterium]